MVAASRSGAGLTASTIQVNLVIPLVRAAIRPKCPHRRYRETTGSTPPPILVLGVQILREVIP